LESAKPALISLFSLSTISGGVLKRAEAVEQARLEAWQKIAHSRQIRQR
jgi:hypothetical protein